MSKDPRSGGWTPETRPSGGGWTRAITFAGVLAGAIALLAWLLRDRGPAAAPAPAGDARAGGAGAPAAAPGAAAGAGGAVPDVVGAAAGGPTVELLDLWVLGGELRGTLANRGGRTLSEVAWAMSFVPGYDAENDYGGEGPPVIEVAGSHDTPIAAGGRAVVTLGEPPGWYLDVRLHPMQLHARYEIVDPGGRRSGSEQSARLVLFHVRSEEELEEIRRAYASPSTTGRDQSDQSAAAPPGDAGGD